MSEQTTRTPGMGAGLEPQAQVTLRDVRGPVHTLVVSGGLERAAAAAELELVHRRR